MELLSFAYLGALSAQCGFTSQRAEVDTDSRDGTITAIGGRRGKLDYQLKAHGMDVDEVAGASFSFELKIKNYNELRTVDVTTPQLLFVILMPRNPAERCALTPEGLLLRRAGYWINLRGQPDVQNDRSRTIQVPLANVLDSPALSGIMQRISLGQEP